MRTAAALIGALVILSACGTNGTSQAGQTNGWTQANQAATISTCVSSNQGYSSSQLNTFCTCVLNAAMPIWTYANFPTDPNNSQLQQIEQQCGSSSGLAVAGNGYNYNY